MTTFFVQPVWLSQHALLALTFQRVIVRTSNSSLSHYADPRHHLRTLRSTSRDLPLMALHGLVQRDRQHALGSLGILVLALHAPLVHSGLSILRWCMGTGSDHYSRHRGDCGPWYSRE
jgi:hypothetical protein